MKNEEEDFTRVDRQPTGRVALPRGREELIR